MRMFIRNILNHVDILWLPQNHIEGFAQDCSNSILAILQEKKKTDFLKYSQLFLIDIWTVW